MVYIRKIACFFLFIISLHSIQGCSGCSPSGRRNYRKKNSIARESNLYYETPTSNPESYSKSRNAASKLSLNELYNIYKKSVFLIITSDGKNNFQGSGFFVSKNGLAVSNYHVFEGTNKGMESIKTLDGQQFKIIEVLEKDKDNDYIIFRVNIGNYKIENPIPLAKEEPQIGQDVFAIGNPRGLESTLTKGIVSALRLNNSLIQTTTEITHGSSGGPLLNMKGEVIGITTAGMGEANLNFAVNIKLLRLERFL